MDLRVEGKKTSSRVGGMAEKARRYQLLLLLISLEKNAKRPLGQELRHLRLPRLQAFIIQWVKQLREYFQERERLQLFDP